MTIYTQLELEDIVDGKAKVESNSESFFLSVNKQVRLEENKKRTSNGMFFSIYEEWIGKVGEMFFSIWEPEVRKWEEWGKKGEIEKFNDWEKFKMKQFYTLLAKGGKYMGYPEAGDLLLNYLRGDNAEGIEKGSPYIVSSEVYEKSAIVQYAMELMRGYIKRDLKDGRLDKKSWSSRELFKPIPGRNIKTQGNFTRDGYLIPEQMNQRLQKMNNVFSLVVNVRVNENKNTVELEWIVEDSYFFKSYKEDPQMYTEFRVGSYKFKLDDGLSQYLETLGIARSFWYRASWREEWKWK